MSTDDKIIWPEDAAKGWAKCTADMQVAKNRCRRWQRLNAVVAVGNMAMAALHAYEQSYWLSLMSTLLCWWLYRFYLASRQWAEWWHLCYHHASRVLQETDARAAWHLEQVEAILVLAKETVVLPIPFSRRNE